MTYEENTEDGVTTTAWVRPPPVPTHKTTEITKTEWRSIMTPAEQLRNDRARANINGDMTWLTGTVAIDDAVDVVEYPQLAVFAGFTYRDILRTTFAAYDDAIDLDVNSGALQVGAFVQSITGLLDSAARLPVILKGLPL